MERDPQRVKRDVQEGWISEERARDVYGVVLDRDREVDEPATYRLRKSEERS
jgi:N-methylhydantoinase B